MGHAVVFADIFKSFPGCLQVALVGVLLEINRRGLDPLCQIDTVNGPLIRQQTGMEECCGIVESLTVNEITQFEEKWLTGNVIRSEEHTSELQSRENLVCRLLLEKKNNTLQT